jgi:hypothetical protein
MAPLLLHYFWESAPMTVYVGAKKGVKKEKKEKTNAFSKKVRKKRELFAKIAKKVCFFFKNMI